MGPAVRLLFPPGTAAFLYTTLRIECTLGVIKVLRNAFFSENLILKELYFQIMSSRIHTSYEICCDVKRFSLFNFAHPLLRINLPVDNMKF